VRLAVERAVGDEVGAAEEGDAPEFVSPKREERQLNIRRDVIGSNQVGEKKRGAELGQAADWQGVGWLGDFRALVTDTGDIHRDDILDPRVAGVPNI
jgi:hypothetical protein